MGLSLLASVLFSSSCSIFGGGDTGVMIDRVESSTNEAGTTIVTMYFTDEDLEPLTFEIPRGEVGEVGPIGAAGVGIENITSRPSDDGKSTILTVSFTSEEMPDKEFTVPNGVSIVSTNSSYDPEDNSTIITFTLSDGTVIPRDGEDEIKIFNGKDGVGITNVICEQDETTLDYTIKITYSGEIAEGVTETTIHLPYQNGEDGIGVAAIIGNQVGDTYILTIQYTDGTSKELTPILLPQATIWLYGNGAPTSIDVLRAKEGDYYFDLLNYAIYIFTDGRFNLIINLTEDNAPTSECVVTFDANGGFFTSSKPTSFSVTKGRPIPYGMFPTCEKDGAKFIGFYTLPEGPNDPLSGKLTDLTPIYNDMTFYACYEDVLSE